jgi:sulfonate transport system ATP-binding protein
MLKAIAATKSFADGVVTLGPLDLDVPPGSITAVVGPTGCGKSTLLRLLSGLTAPSGGMITHQGRAVLEPQADFSVMFQEPRLLPWLTVEGNVRFGLGHLPPTEQARHAAEVLARVELGHVGQLWPKHLSGGMAQRVALARAIVTRPRILFLDEPFSAVDALTRTRLQDYVLSWWSQQRDTSIVLVTHDVEEAVVFADQVLVLDGPPAVVRRSFSIDLRRPRDRLDRQVLRSKTAVLEVLHSATQRLAIVPEARTPP